MQRVPSQRYPRAAPAYLPASTEKSQELSRRSPEVQQIPAVGTSTTLTKILHLGDSRSLSSISGDTVEARGHREVARVTETREQSVLTDGKDADLTRSRVQTVQESAVG